MSRKKIIFFIVEGIADKTALAVALEKIYSNQRVVVKVVGGDITSDYKTTPENVPKKIVELVKNGLGRGFQLKTYYK